MREIESSPAEDFNNVKVAFYDEAARDYFRQDGYNNKQIDEILDGVYSDIPLKIRKLYEKVDFTAEKMDRIKLAHRIGMPYSKIKELSKKPLKEINYEIQYFMLEKEEKRKNDRKGAKQ